MADWPWNDADILAGSMTRGTGENARRTQFDSGETKQARISQLPLRVRTFTINVVESKIDRFEGWSLSVGPDFFNFHVEGVEREMRVRGGKIDLQRAPDRTRWRGERFYTADVTLEGYW